MLARPRASRDCPRRYWLPQKPLHGVPTLYEAGLEKAARVPRSCGRQVQFLAQLREEVDDVPQDLDGLEDFVVGLTLELPRLYPAEDWADLAPACR